MRILAQRQFSDPSSTTGLPWILFCNLNLPIGTPVDTMERPPSRWPVRRQREFRDGTQRPAQPYKASIRNFGRAMKWIYLVLYPAAPRQLRRQRPAGYQRVQYRSLNAAYRHARHCLVRIRRRDRKGCCTRPSPENRLDLEEGSKEEILASLLNAHAIDEPKNMFGILDYESWKSETRFQPWFQLSKC